MTLSLRATGFTFCRLRNSLSFHDKNIQIQLHLEITLTF